MVPHGRSKYTSRLAIVLLADPHRYPFQALSVEKRELNRQSATNEFITPLLHFFESKSLLVTATAATLALIRTDRGRRVTIDMHQNYCRTTTATKNAMIFAKYSSSLNDLAYLHGSRFIRIT
ncbi:hypothetical protein Y032_0179g716 [Ancylostoma ceylanicum]|uniref:Uncharacterized protein n=1 Tax=Ancylostoma ceylanicum TaxID=53326 RepID=A0A016SSN8_9BILA|nr:hypothetical protein Y032_0179g716 [Ancylostoma ceylanicum]